MNEKPLIPFYKPYGMSDEEFQQEVALATQRLAEWEEEQRLEIMKTCDHEFVAREYSSQPFGTCLCCGKFILN